MSKEKDRLLEDLLIIRSYLDDAYHNNDKEWIEHLQKLQTEIYKQLSVLGESIK